MSRVLIVCWLLFNASYAFADVETKQTGGTGKKGACFSRQNDQWSYKISQLKANWYYSWGRELREERPKNVEFVPMFWGKWFKDDDIEYLLNLKNQNQIKFVLGFNEPDSPDQSNMSVDEAIALWPKLEAIGLPLGSPATVNPENKWMINFMQKADDLGLRVDFICVHHYGGKNVQGLLHKLHQVHQRYNRPIWITEFAVADWNAKSTGQNRHSAEDVLKFMEGILPALESLEYVSRYAWFSASSTSKPLGRATLFDENNHLTALGRHYASFQPTKK